ncbi:citrulline utilization hydrolase CtlX [Paraglaciecola chathamensis]|uniref:Amidinotransferase n=1 Tax=Paraglaciecola agarilytica NO2 TaxID=1125747 RepID=A0ABQ0I5P4_9ALTE|nr:arginine deiminase-related protein [Paraglaciecola agarilytica]GAC04653.1 amidinotransferase [Paraglaciecola agarilytica NO2]
MQKLIPTKRNPQAPSAVIMIRPHHFYANPQTEGDNAFQRLASEPMKTADLTGGGNLSKQAYEQVTNAAKILTAHGIQVHIFEDETQDKPDSVFPNNWFSTHSGGHIAIYPMFAENRRKERRSDIIDMLKQKYRVQDVLDYSGLEHDGLYLEGTGAMVLDHIERVAYAVQSNRTNPLALERFCSHFNYEPMLFDAADEHGTAVYHTNVLMCIGTDFVMLGSDMVSDETRRNEIITRFEASGREVITLTPEQIAEFCGNALELQSAQQRLLAMSQRAYDALTSAQRDRLEKSVALVPLDVSAIETAGGSIRCMLAGIHLAARSI